MIPKQGVLIQDHNLAETLTNNTKYKNNKIPLTEGNLLSVILTNYDHTSILSKNSKIIELKAPESDHDSNHDTDEEVKKKSKKDEEKSEKRS